MYTQNESEENFQIIKNFVFLFLSKVIIFILHTYNTHKPHTHTCIHALTHTHTQTQVM